MKSSDNRKKLFRDIYKKLYAIFNRHRQNYVEVFPLPRIQTTFIKLRKAQSGYLELGSTRKARNRSLYKIIVLITQHNYKKEKSKRGMLHF